VDSGGPGKHVFDIEVHIGASLQIRLNRPCAADFTGCLHSCVGLCSQSQLPAAHCQVTTVGKSFTQSLSPSSTLVFVNLITFRVRRSRGENFSILYLPRPSVCLCVCLSFPAFPRYCTDPDVSWGMVGVPSSCALLGGFAIGSWVSLL